MSADGPRGTFRRALATTLVMTAGHQVTTLLVMLILAGLLSPAEFGVVALAAVYLAFVQLLLDAGLSIAIIQRPRLRRGHMDTLFWANLGVCLVAAASSAALAPWWASANSLPALAPVIAALSLALPIHASVMVHGALLQRRMRFERLAIAANSASVVGGVVGVVMALKGASYWALVGQQLSAALTNAALLWVLTDFRPRWSFRWARLRQVVGFSGAVLAGRLGNFAATRSDALLIGLFFGPTAVGLFRLADRLVNTALQVVTRALQMASLPHFASLQAQPDRLREAAAQSLRLSVSASVPMLAGVAALAEPLMALLGEAWMPAAPVLRWLCVYGMVRSVALIVGPLLNGTGRPLLRSLGIWLTGAMSIGFFVGVAALLADQPDAEAAVGIALAKVSVAGLVTLPFSVITLAWVTGLGARAIFGCLVPSLVAGAAAFGVGALLLGATPIGGWPAWSQLLLTAPLVGLVGLGLVLLLDRSLRQPLLALCRRCAEGRGSDRVSLNGTSA